MKKLISFIIILCALASTAFFKNGQNSIFKLNGIEKVCLVSDERVSGVESLQCGDLIFNYCTLEQAEEKFAGLKNCQAVQLYFNNVEIKTMLAQLKCQYYKESDALNLKIYIGYTPLFADFIYVDNKKVNFQIVLSENGVIAGFPAILTGF